MKRRDYNNYKKLFREMTHFLQPPDLMIYLRASLPKLVKQIRRRGREFEKNIDVDYLGRLNTSYEEWIKSYSLGKLVIVESDKMDFVNRRKDFDKIVNLIRKNLNLK